MKTSFPHRKSGIDKKLLNVMIVFGLLSAWPFMFMIGLSSGATEKEQKTVRFMAGWMIDRDVITEDGKVIGEIADIIIERNGNVKAVIVEMEGILEFGDKQVSMGLEKLKKRGDKLEAAATRSEVEKRPEVRYQEIGLHTSYSAYLKSGEIDGSRTYSPARYLASVIMGRNTYNHDGQSLGQVEDLLIANGEVEALILSQGGLVPKGHIAAPYQPLDIGRDGFIYDITRKALENLSEYPYEAVMEEPMEDGPFGPYYTPPGVVETDEPISIGR
ncbi:MAG: PRC-barrel domain-containing protein [Deltaproteobacteria bacterium]|nr:PRC-barrel domain-containing protein [Deltaproteobacteria bacterium]